MMDITEDLKAVPETNLEKDEESNHSHGPRVVEGSSTQKLDVGRQVFLL
jgi:hypothetical protein